MPRLRLLGWGLVVLTTANLTIPNPLVFAELKPGDKLDEACANKSSLKPEQ